MTTDELIAALAADSHSPVPLNRAVLFGFFGGTIVSAILLQLSIGVRPDIVAAFGTWRFLLKMALLVTTIGLVSRSCMSAGRPIRVEVWPLVAGLAALLAAAVVTELSVSPREEWGARWLGTNAMLCLISIPILSAVPLALLLTLMRSAAPSSPTQAGAIIGGLAAAIGSSIYATHCFDDSPLFIATWYLCGALPVVVLGAVLGRRLLRW
jgi:hypothetical protein